MNEQIIINNIAKLLERVRLVVGKCQRKEGDITVLAVSKTRSSSQLRVAYQRGFRNFGENYLSEALAKIEELQDLDIVWHFIGPVQSNKTRQIAEHFDWIHSVDRLKIARRLSEQRPNHLPPLQICIQVNISEEMNKSGATLAELPELARDITALPHITLRGLMAIPEATTDPVSQRAAFAKLNKAMLSLQTQMPQLDTLSMGMSGDMEAAIAEGSTIVRIGTDIFGPRNM
ncbi:MAG: YggS family pyridoxal phosphate-dependent enzyme [Halioglobus sp.]